MKLLYCHDNIYLQSELGHVYSQGQFSYSYFQPFIDGFGEVMVIGRGTPLSKNLDIQKLNVSSGDFVDFTLMPNINTPRNLLKHYKTIKKSVRPLVAESDAVVIRAVSDLGWIVYQCAKAMNKPVAMEMTACAWDSTWNHGSPYGKVYAPMRYIRDKIITKNADAVIYVSQNFLQQRYPSNALKAVASNVRIGKADDAVLEQRLKKIENSATGDMSSIGLIGTLGHRLKGIDTALIALRAIEKRSPGRFIFKILGPGRAEKYRDLVHKMGLNHCVFFDGILPSGEAVLDWLKDIDIYIQPSFQEGLPRATIEAMSVGCPVIGSTAGGIPELLLQEWLHKLGDAKALERCLEKMLSDKAARKQAAIRNFAKAKDYTADRLEPVRARFWSDFADLSSRR